MATSKDGTRAAVEPPQETGAAEPAPRNEKTTSGHGSLMEEYGRPDWPLSAYAGLIATYLATIPAFLAVAKKQGKPLPDGLSARDLALVAAATQKLSRLITKDWVAIPLRAPFTRYEGPGGPAEVREKARGEGLQMAIGELLTCPWCASQWIGTALAYGMVLRPRYTRFLCGVLTSVLMADFLNLGYSAAERRA